LGGEGDGGGGVLFSFVFHCIVGTISTLPRLDKMILKSSSL
jgi:hypothetical protein